MLLPLYTEGPGGTDKMRTKAFAIWLTLFPLVITTLPASAGTISYLLRTPTAAQAQAVCQRYNLQFIANLGHADLFLVQASDALSPDVLKQWVKNDSDVENLEVDKQANVVETGRHSHTDHDHDRDRDRDKDRDKH
jgi:hypothetical protein